MGNSQMVTQIRNDLRAKIISLQLKDGDRLTETRIADRYGTSRTNVKEALKLLENEHLARYVPLKGYFVVGVSDQLVEEIAIIRQSLEATVFKKCLEVITDEELATLRHIADRYILFIQNNMIADANEEANAFYQKVYSICPYKRIISILETYSEYIESFISLSEATKAYWQESAQNSDDLVSAMERRDEAEMLRQIELRHLHLMERRRLFLETLEKK